MPTFFVEMAGINGFSDISLHDKAFLFLENIPTVKLLFVWLFVFYTLNFFLRIEEVCIAENVKREVVAEKCEADCQCAGCLKADDLVDIEDSLDFIRSKICTLNSESFKISEIERGKISSHGKNRSQSDDWFFYKLISLMVN
ncbi:hypothetical protein [Pseudomonas caricapapayae]|uniref:hypothetical protein n=1 Tax=Pseudomonas caricapapayae TaxID=46678 RepID=UPI000EFF6930|nr:hypothetical protein [Pseudomonas caricapapayae]